MSNYENAPATKILATHCAACARPLLDAVSVEAGMGPDCRKKYMRADGATAEARTMANLIVNMIALKISGNPDFAETNVGIGIDKLRELGFDKLADKLTKAHVSVRIEREAGARVVVSGYSESFVDAARRIPGRRWDKERKATTFPESAASDVFAALKASYPGATAHGPKGYFVL